MKPLKSELQDAETLRQLGSAAVQIVHDLKNQLNGLKLYATFLRKRLEKSERPADELETVNKLIGGLDRTADDLSMIVQYGQPLQLKKQPGIDLLKIVQGVVASLNDSPRITGALVDSIVIDSGPAPLVGEFDSAALTDALKSISLSAMKMLTTKSHEDSLHISLQSEPFETKSAALIEWKGLDSLNHDPFHSFSGSVEIRMSLAARVIEAHGGLAERQNGALRVRLPLT